MTYGTFTPPRNQGRRKLTLPTPLSHNPDDRSYLENMHTHTHSHTHPPHTPTLTHAYTGTHIHTHSRIHKHTHAHTHKHTCTHTHALMHTHTLTLSHTLTVMFLLSHFSQGLIKPACLALPAHDIEWSWMDSSSAGTCLLPTTHLGLLPAPSGTCAVLREILKCKLFTRTLPPSSSLV